MTVVSVAAAIVALLAMLWRARSSLLLVTINGDSMAPDLNRGDVVLVHRRRRYRSGNIALLRLEPGSMPMVKRIVAVAGDPVPDAIRHAIPGMVVPTGAVVVLGTRPDSIDSRRLGPVPVERVVGVVVGRVRRQAPEVTR
ncbi:S26 family signal peptidase [Dactylosporangium sucinum]|uniref:S26 family signal peptidase n=1 Tax=Dactylosporangium sucinum TaxID=1424081 RepID=A0A917U252_9ACTN|nr:S26 family signal peptidase [Dactylosporangium sucinum]GGM49509.1 S26 family signal peptidase [Dactylosporangium sucinum]